MTVTGDGLRVEGPRSAEALVRQIQAQKAEVIQALQSLCGWCEEREADGGTDPGGGRWCIACRDGEQGLQAELPALTEGRSLRAAWAGAVRELGELAGHPDLNFKPGHAVALGPVGWTAFTKRASVEDLRLVLARLRLLVAELPSPDDETS